MVGPVKTQFGYHLIKVEKKNEAKEAGFAEVKDPIRAELLKRKQDQAYLAKAKELKEKYVQNNLINFSLQKDSSTCKKSVL